MIGSALYRLFSILLSRAFWTFVGLVAAALLIWFIGPLIAIGDWQPLVGTWARFWTIVALVALVLLRILLRRWRRSATNAGVTERLREVLATRRTEESGEIVLLRQRFDEALAILRRTRFAGKASSFMGRLLARGRYLYELPWYIIIGAPGAGKTTALLNSGLGFPLAKSHGRVAIKGVGGTRNCDWWFTDEAVLIDTAGRYTTHESDGAADKAEWRGFMGLLRKTRASQPINGVLVAVSVTELLDAGSDGRRAHAEILRERLDELRNDLGIAFPVYLLVSKCDLLRGFDEYFAPLDRAGREQVWGATFPYVEGRTMAHDGKAVSEELGLLMRRVDAGLVDALQRESELVRREALHSFPQQFALLCDSVRELSERLFADSRFSAAPMLRGIYFTSGTQEGTPLDRVVNTLGARPQATEGERVGRETGKSYFLRELLSRVVFAEAHLAGHNRKVNRRSRALHYAAYAASVLLLVGAIGAWTTSYRNNLTYIAEVDAKVDPLGVKLIELPPTVDGNIYALLEPLSAAETLPDSVRFRAPDPLTPWTFGLYQGGKLEAGARPIYEDLLRTRLAPTLKLRLESLLRSVALEDLEFAYEILKAYLMMHQPERFDPEAFKGFVLADWDYNMPAGSAPEERHALERHVSALIALGSVFPASEPDSVLVAETRARLKQFTLAERSYRRLARAMEHNQLPDFSVAQVIGTAAPSVFRRKSGLPLTDGVLSLYTYRGYHELFSPEVDNVLRYVGRDDGWVLGVDESAVRDSAQAIAGGKLGLEVKRLYMWDYVAKWERFIDDVTLVDVSSLNEAAELARLLSSADSPLAWLMQAVVKETTLLKDTNQRTGSDQSLFDRVKRTARATQDDVTRVIGPSRMPGRLAPTERPELIVDNRFEALRRSVGGTGEGAPSGPMASTLQTLSELHLMLGSVAAARAGGYAPPASDLPVRLKAEASRMPPPTRQLLESIADAGGELVAREARVVKGREMVGTVTRMCRDSIQGRYPLVRGATNEVAADDFTRMFGPGGAIDGYFERELANVVDRSSSPWRLLPGAQGGRGAGAALAEFEKASAVKDVFFRGGAGAPTVTVLIKPIEMDVSITNLVLDIDGQTLRYQHGPQVGQTVRWPGTRGSQQVRLVLEPALEGMTSAVVLEGPWALHRLFDQARIVPGSSPQSFRATFDVGGRKATFEVTAGSAKNPFALRELREFSCPAGL
jgi:type VI secretion system protein ImpL